VAHSPEHCSVWHHFALNNHNISDNIAVLQAQGDLQSGDYNAAMRTMIKHIGTDTTAIKRLYMLTPNSFP
jgi:hypothetical protein